MEASVTYTQYVTEYELIAFCVIFIAKYEILMKITVNRNKIYKLKGPL